jgi:Antitoxin SocA-like, Panacea domain
MHKRDRRFRELLLYVARETRDDPKCGRTKLYKILFYADFLAFRKRGTSISGQEYQRLQFGPAPKRVKPVIDQMIRERLCDWSNDDYYGRLQKRLVPLRQPDLSVFSAEEIDDLQHVIRELRPFDATDVSVLSHQFIGWQLAREKEDIPYSTVALGDPRPPTQEEIEYGRRLAAELSV